MKELNKKELENMSKEELINIIEIIKNSSSVNYKNHEYEEVCLQEEISQYESKLERLDYVDYGYGIGCYGAL